MGDSSRRELLLRGAIGVGAAVSLAGCADEFEDGIDELEALLEDEGESGESEDPEVTPGELPSFHQWLYAPGEVRLDPYTYASADFTEIDGGFDPLEDWQEFRWTTETIRDVRDDEMFDGAESAVVMEYEDERSFAAAVEGEFDRSRIREDLEEAVDREPDVEYDSYRGYHIYFEDQHAVGLGDEDVPTFLQARVPNGGSTSVREPLEAMIDARGGNTPRLTDAETTAEALLGTVDDHEFVFGATEPVGRNEPMFQHRGDVSIEGANVAVRGDTYRLTAVTDTPIDDEDAFVEAFDIAAVLNDPSVSQNGQVVVLEGEIGSPEPDSGDVPEANFEVEFHTDQEVAEITYTHGDEIPADELEIVIDGDSRRRLRWAQLSHSDVAHPGEIVSLQLEAEDSGGELAFVWKPEGEVLSTVDVPEFDTHSDIPSASFDAQFDHDRGTVTITQTEGDELPADDVILLFATDSQRPAVLAWGDLTSESTLEPGSSVTIELYDEDYGGHLTVSWLPESEFFDEFRIPDSDGDTDESHDEHHHDDDGSGHDEHHHDGDTDDGEASPDYDDA